MGIPRPPAPTTCIVMRPPRTIDQIMRYYKTVGSMKNRWLKAAGEGRFGAP